MDLHNAPGCMQSQLIRFGPWNPAPLVQEPSLSMVQYWLLIAGASTWAPFLCCNSALFFFSFSLFSLLFKNQNATAELTLRNIKSSTSNARGGPNRAASRGTKLRKRQRKLPAQKAISQRSRGTLPRSVKLKLRPCSHGSASSAWQSCLPFSTAS